MEFIDSRQVDIEIVEKQCFDIFIVAAGYESRSVSLIENYMIKAENKIAFAYSKFENKSAREKNNNTLLKHGFSFIELSDHESEPIRQEILDLLGTLKKKNISILIDYSCMTKLWYATMINVFLTESIEESIIDVYFSYTSVVYSKMKKISFVPKFRSMAKGLNPLDSSRPTALIVGLGMEKGLADECIKKLKPDLLYLMCADPYPDDAYIHRVLENNQELINRTDIGNLSNYPLNDLDRITDILTSTSLKFRLKYNVVIASLGPKVFSLIAFLLASRYPDITVWRTENNQTKSPVDRMAIKEPLVLKVRFSNIDED